MNDVPLISVIVPHYSDLAGLDRCLTALCDQYFPADRFEVIVADNGSPEGVPAIETVIAGRARLVVVADRGAGPARNGGVAEARGSILAFTDSDCQPEPEWLAAGLAAFRYCEFAGGAMAVKVADDRRPTGTEAFERVFAFDNEDYVRNKGFTVTANLFCPRALFDRVGGFRTGVPEDLEWSLRARGAGYRIGYAAGAVVAHPARRDWPELRRKWARLNAESYGLFVSRRLGRLSWLARSWALPGSAVVHSLRVLRSPKLATPAQRVAALAILFRLRLWRLVDAHRLLLAHGKRGA